MHDNIYIGNCELNERKSPPSHASPDGQAKSPMSSPDWQFFKVFSGKQKDEKASKAREKPSRGNSVPSGLGLITAEEERESKEKKPRRASNAQGYPRSPRSSGTKEDRLSPTASPRDHNDGEKQSAIQDQLALTRSVERGPVTPGSAQENSSSLLEAAPITNSPSEKRLSEPHITPTNSPQRRAAEMGVVERARGTTVGNDSKPYVSHNAAASGQRSTGRKVHTGSPLSNAYTFPSSSSISGSANLERPSLVNHHFPSSYSLSEATRNSGSHISTIQARHGSELGVGVTPSGSRNSASDQDLVKKTRRVTLAGGQLANGAAKGIGIGDPSSRCVEVSPTFIPSAPSKSRNATASPKFGHSKNKPHTSPHSAILAESATVIEKRQSLASMTMTQSASRFLSADAQEALYGSSTHETISEHMVTVENTVVQGWDRGSVRGYDSAPPAIEYEPEFASTLPFEFKIDKDDAGRCHNLAMMEEHLDRLDGLLHNAKMEEEKAYREVNQANTELWTAEASLWSAEAAERIARAKMQISSGVLAICQANVVSASEMVRKWKEVVKGEEARLAGH
ncbi:hypothetical protein ONZ45_g17190 [Pleurotus djamor]|nr:hypothetical protein ONZ45_g17190 [Pleurotus djamor]